MNSRVTGVNHTSFTVTDVKRTMDYFIDVLGFSELSFGPRDPKMVQAVLGIEDADMIVGYVQGHGLRVELIEYTAPADRRVVDSRPCDAGFGHIGLDVRDLDGVCDRLKAKGLKPTGSLESVHQGPNSGTRVVFLRDWDGVGIELIERPDA